MKIKIGAKHIIHTLACLGSIFAHCTYCTQTTSINQLIDTTTDTIIVEVKQSTKDLIHMLDTTVINGKLPIFKALKNKRQSKKKIKTTAQNLEKIILTTLTNIEKQNTQCNPIIKEKTDKFVSKTKKRVFDMHKKMVSQMRKSIGIRNPELVNNNTNNTKNEIVKFEKQILMKIAKFSNKLKKLSQ